MQKATLSVKRPIVGAWQSTVLRRDGKAPRRARQAVRMWLGESHPLRFDAEQVVAELVNNSVLHVPISGTCDWVRVHLGFGDDFIRLDVIDPGTDVPAERFVPREPGGGEESGRGLQIASELSERWSTHLIERGHRVVWCDLKMPDERSFDDASPGVSPERAARRIAARHAEPREGPSTVAAGAS
ncbi:ATP-binding protein [Nonomuraea angiospora]